MRKEKSNTRRPRVFTAGRALIVATLAVTTLVAAQESPLAPRVAELVASTRAQHQIPGLSVAVVRDGRRVYSGGFGSAALGPAPAVDGDTQYRLASVSKVFTAIAVLQGAGRGALDLDRPARDYCPVLAALNGAPTVRHLLAHQSGIRHTNDDEDEGITGAFPMLERALRNIAKERLQFAPGSKALYTSWGYAALGCVLETVAGQSYADVVSGTILSVAGLGNTAFDLPTYTSPRFSPGFRLVGGVLAPSLVVDTQFKRPASGVISSVNDLASLATALFDGQLLGPAQFKEMLTVPSLPAGEKSPFTAGWIVSQAALGPPAYSYNGSMEGSTAYLLIVPERRVAVALLANRERFVPQVHPLVIEIAKAALDGRQE